MPTWLKIILAIVAIGIAAMIGIGFVAYNWAMKNKESLASAQNEGVAYGKGKTTEQCIDASLPRLGDSALSIGKQVNAQLFITGCLKSAEKSEALCATVPPSSEIMKSAQWGVNECRKRGVANQQGCAQLFQIVAQSCAR